MAKITKLVRRKSDNIRWRRDLRKGKVKAQGSRHMGCPPKFSPLGWGDFRTLIGTFSEELHNSPLGSKEFNLKMSLKGLLLR